VRPRESNPGTVTHPSTNRAQFRQTSLIKTKALPLHQTATCCKRMWALGMMHWRIQGFAWFGRNPLPLIKSPFIMLSWRDAVLHSFIVHHCSITAFGVRRTRGEMYIGHSRLCVSLSLATFPHFCTDPDVTKGNGRGCAVVVHY